MANPHGTAPCTALWLSVLNSVVTDLSGGSVWHDPIERALAERWVGAFPSRDFREVCQMAGVDPDAAHSGFRKLIEREREERAARREELEAAQEAKRQKSRGYRRVKENQHHVRFL